MNRLSIVSIVLFQISSVGICADAQMGKSKPLGADGVHVVGLSVAMAGAEDGMTTSSVRGLMSGTNVYLVVQQGSQFILGMNDEGSKIESVQDDKGKALNARFGFGGEASADGVILSEMM